MTLSHLAGLRRAAPLTLALVLTSCSGSDSPTAPDPGPPAPTVGSVTLTSAPADGVVGSSVEVSLRVDDTTGSPMSGVAVSLSVTGGGSLSASSVTTSTGGLASATWTYGTTAGAQTITATTSGRTATASITATPDVAAQIAKISGDGQTGPAGEALPAAAVAEVQDQFGNAVSGEAVGATVASGGGSFAPITGVTGDDGRVSVTWTLGTVVGENSLDVTHSTGTVTFTAQAAAGAPATFSAVSGGDETVTVGAQASEPVTVELMDQHGNLVPDATVAFVVTAGGGSVSAETAATDSQGRATTSWTMGTAAGEQRLEARVEGLTTILFTNTAVAGPPAELRSISGDGQSGTVGAAASQPLIVHVVDAFGNPTAGASVTFTATAGGGAATPATAESDAAGRVSTVWTLGPTAGSQTLEATSGSLAPVSFTAVAAPGAPATVVVVSGDAQTVGVNEALAEPLVAAVEDAFGNRVPIVSVSFTASTGALDPTSAVSDAEGQATTAWTLGTVAGSQTVTAAADGATSATFTATVQPGPAASLSLLSGDNQEGPAASALAEALAVVARDEFGNGVPGVSVLFAVTAGGGSLSATSVTTGAEGSASTVFTLGSSVGANTAVASAVGLGTVTFTAESKSGPPAAIGKTSGDASTRFVGSTAQVEVEVTDALGNKVAGASVTFTIGSGGGSVASVASLVGSGGSAALVSATSVTNALGLAAANWTLGATPGANTLTAAVAGGPSVTFTATAEADPTAGFDIEVRIIGSMSASVQAAFAAAEARWEQVITGDVPDFGLTAAAATCGANDPGFNELVDDLIILAEAGPIDGSGQVLGQAGPCWVRPGSNLPIVGTMKFDEADLLDLQADGTLTDVIIHEMGHALGIGTLWTDLSLLSGAGTADPFFSGTEAVAAYQSLGGIVTNGVPVANTGGSGTRDAHWRESVFRTELMTGFLSGSTRPLSTVTVESLEDLGYTVDGTSADSYTLPTAVPPSQLVEEPGPAWEILLKPVGSPGSGGAVRRDR